MGSFEGIVRVDVGCDDRTEFRQKRLGSVYRDEFPVEPVAGLSEGDACAIELVLRNGVPLIKGTAMVTAARGPSPNQDKMMLAFIELSEGELELQKEAWTEEELEASRQAEHGASAVPPGFEPLAARRFEGKPARRRSVWPWLMATAALAAVGIAGLMWMGGEPEPAAQAKPTEAPAKTEPADADREAVDDHLAKADERLAAGRIVGPGGDQALDHLLAAREIAPDDARVEERLTAIADRFEKLAEDALAEEALAEAATHLQIVITADPSRDAARERIAEIESKVRGQ